MKKKSIVKGILLTLLALVAILALWILAGFYGNPLSKYLANRAADTYLETHYRDLDLDRSETYYNFKDGAYMVWLQDKNSIDSKFSLAFDWRGRLKYDSYPNRIFNSYIRFTDQLRQYGRKLEKDHDFPYKINLSPLDQDDLEDQLTLDQEVDFNHFPSRVQAQAYGYSKEPQIQEALKILQDLQKIMDTSPLRVETYSIILVPEKDRKPDGEAESWAHALTIFDIPQDLVRQGDLAGLERILKEEETQTKD